MMFYNLKTEVAGKVLQHYTVLDPPQVQKINVNTASAEKLASVAYIRYKDAYALINYRENTGKIQSLEELAKILDFPIKKINIIKLYLKAE